MGVSPPIRALRWSPTLVSAAGSGTYVGADVKSSTGANGYAGWALVVVFTSEALPLRNLVVFDGFANVTLSETEGTADTVETTLTGFLTPVSGAFRTRVGVVAYEGDADQHRGPAPPQQCDAHQCCQSLDEYLQQHQYRTREQRDHPSSVLCQSPRLRYRRL